MFDVTEIVPSGFTVNGPFGVDVNVISPGAVPIVNPVDPFTVSLMITLGVLVPGNTLGVSVTAIIAGAVTLTVVVTVLQFAGLLTSQIV